MYFEKAGKENTDATLDLAVRHAREHGLEHIVVASTRGDTALKAARRIEGTGLKLVVVTHNAGFGDPGTTEFDPAVAREVEKVGGVVHTGTMVLRGLGKAILKKTGFGHEDLVANVLRMFGQGMKVCVEIAAMAADAGLVPAGDLVAVAGTARGADTAAVIKADSSNRFFDLKVKVVIAKPAEF